MPPSFPQELKSEVGKGNVLLNWKSSTDDTTPSKGLTYNIRIGTVSGGDNIVFPYSQKETGKRLITNNGNADHLLFKTINSLKPGNYYWSVQAIDNSYVGSAWAPEQTFTIKSNNIPVANAGSDQTVNEGTTVTLDGSLSSDPDGSPTTYKWTAPNGISLSSTSAPKPTFKVPEVKKDSTLIFSLIVNDGFIDSQSSTVRVNVLNVIKVGVNDISKSELMVYPNPTSGIIKIEGLPINQKTKITIHTVDGKLIRKKISSSITETIDISDQVPGTYLLNINKKSFKIQKK